MTPTAIEGLLPLQRALLEGLLPLLAETGTLVYATCTIHPAENTAQIQWLLEHHPGLRLVDETQRWPDAESGGDGFYAAVLHRR